MLSPRRLFAPAPPPAGADQVTQWRWVRAAQVRQLAIVAPLVVVVAVFLGLPPVLLVLALLGLLAGVVNALVLTRRIRQAESAGAARER